MGCLVRLAGSLLLLLALAILARRVLESPAPIPPTGPGERDTIVNGVRWRSRETPGSGIPVLYVHGLLSTSASWKRALAPASGGRPAVAVDLPGFGLSDRPWPYDYTVGGQADALLRYLDARGFDRVVLVGSASPISNIPWNFRLLRVPVLGEIEMELVVRPVVELGLRHRLFARGERVTQEEVDEDWRSIRVPGTRRAALAAVRSSSRGYEGYLARIRIPTMVLWGKGDRILPPEEGLRLSAEIPGARLVILPDTGHVPQEETPEEFSRAVSQFLDEASRR